ncbi:hypothetical protein NUW54_g875 [Trametes sanguinea]|uniref:Uncharacterized protein n=1 Tax=Trametes sanguinea TaxID=158606 RepID=A0ACC1QAD1_9APHY|nr:hypothetical protein NUW54_g875 [Trametes sanguinea]
MNAKLAATPAQRKEINAPAARPSLHVRCPSSPPEKAAITELAMTIAEEIARLGRSPQPIGVDIPIIHSGLDPKSLSKLQSWLKSAHDYEVSLSRLLEDDLTPEGLAADVLASPRTRQRRMLSKPKQAGSGSFSMSRRSRLPPRAPISVDVTTEPEEVPITSAAVKQYQIAGDIGMAPYESWANKKTGYERHFANIQGLALIARFSLMYGLLALGLVGSPMSPSFRAMKSPAAQPSLNAGSRLRPIPPLEDPRAVMPTRTPLFASFLDSVHMPGVEPIQSPWVPDRQFASLDGMFADMSFPKTPESI